jgi:hypothetical protein
MRIHFPVLVLVAMSIEAALGAEMVGFNEHLCSSTRLSFTLIRLYYKKCSSLQNSLGKKSNPRTFIYL